jgi:hypothetical protein
MSAFSDLDSLPTLAFKSSSERSRGDMLATAATVKMLEKVR